MWGVDWQLVAAGIEMGGNLFACFAALIWAYMTGVVWRRIAPTVLLLAIAVFAFTNANYAFFQIMRYSMPELEPPAYAYDLFESPYENVVLWMQQLATVIIPLSAISTWFMMSKTRMQKRAR